MIRLARLGFIVIFVTHWSSGSEFGNQFSSLHCGLRLQLFLIVLIMEENLIYWLWYSSVITEQNRKFPLHFVTFVIFSPLSDVEQEHENKTVRMASRHQSFSRNCLA